jgi:hypothetical protein
MTGVSAIQYYSVKIYGQIGISGSDALKYQAINNIIALVGEACCVLFVDKLGRRRPLIVGNLFNMVCFLIACVLIGKLSPTSSQGSTNASSQIPTRVNQQPRCILGIHHLHMALQLLLLRNLRAPLLGHSRRDLRHADAG